MAVDARGLELGILAALASVFALSVAQPFLVPLLLGIVISYTLYPNRQHEFSGRVHFAAVLGLAVGHLGNVAQHSHHRHCQGRVAACGAVAPVG
jgi:predicted PurR-regulated permease PerM